LLFLLDTPLLRLGLHTVHTGTGKGGVRVCSFKLAKALIRGVKSLLTAALPGLFR